MHMNKPSSWSWRVDYYAVYSVAPRQVKAHNSPLWTHHHEAHSLSLHIKRSIRPAYVQGKGRKGRYDQGSWCSRLASLLAFRFLDHDR